MNRAVPQRMHNAAADALDDIVEDDLYESREVAPIEEGTLIRSSFTEVDRSSLAAQVAYDTPYAVVQELDVTLRHDSGRKAHYLGDTVEQNKRRHLDHLQSKIAGA